MANVLNTLNYGLGGTSGKSGSLQFMDDGSFIFRPVAGTGVEFAGFLQLDQQAAPAVAPTGSTRLYFDTTAQALQQSIAGGAFAALAVSSLSLGGGSVTISAAGAITATTASGQALTLNGASSSSIILSSAGNISLSAASGGTLTATGGSTSNLFIGAAGGITLNGLSSSLIQCGTNGLCLIQPATGQLATVINFTPVAPSAGMTYALPPLGPTGAAVTFVSAAANLVVLYLVYIPTTITINVIAAKIVTPVAASHLGIGLYTYAGSQASATKLVDITLSAAAAAIVSGAPTQGATLVPAGWYWLAWTVDTASAIQGEGYTVDTLAGTLFTGVAGSRIMAQGATASAAGVLPASTGAIATTAQTAAPLALFGQ